MIDTARILIAEDHLVQAVACADFLRSLGYTVVGPVASLAQARRILADEPIDAALLDVWLRDGAAFPLAADLASRNIPLVFCTGVNEDGLFPDAWRTTPRVEKPYDLADLDQRVRALLADRRTPADRSGADRSPESGVRRGGSRRDAER
ncbi:MAG TPA: response regulator [Phycisphaerae bacterium]|nr:response regulator [Phycisphaerales bacterium]HRX87666.1 response regulator [Phycisphaerae bacterium]